MRKNTIFCFLAAVLLIVSSVGTTFAAKQVIDESTQVIDTATVKARIVEEYEQGSTVYPGGTVAKIVNAKNTGSSDNIIRIKVEKAWGETRDADGKLVVDDTFATDNILIDYNTEYWTYDQTDGYFYYKEVLKPGESTLAPLFEEFKIDEATGNEYGGLMADIVVKLECVQAGADGVSVWEKTLTDLGIEYVETEKTDITTTVTLTDDGFKFNPESTDLFADFKNLLPGETRNQTITIGNDTEEVYSIGVRAELIDQLGDDPDTLALIDKLLKEYATIVITDENGHKLYEGPVWGNLGVDPFEFHGKTMEHNIGLGNFHPDDTKNLNVELMLDPALGNEYQNLLGLIKWVWTASEIPQNNDETVIVAGEKTWKHGSNAQAEQPKEITIHVKADGLIVATEKVTAEHHWKWSFELPKLDSTGKEIVYTVDEEDVPGYTKAIDGYDITNTHETHDQVAVTGSKTWDHGSNTAKPESIVVNVVLDGKKVASKRVTAADNWKWSFTLPKYDESGKVAKYSITEEQVANYTLVKTEGYNLHNKYAGKEYPGDPVVQPPVVLPLGTPGNSGTVNYVAPRTGDSANILLMWIGFMAASAVALVSFVVMGKKSKKEEA